MGNAAREFKKSGSTNQGTAIFLTTQLDLKIAKKPLRKI